MESGWKYLIEIYFLKDSVLKRKKLKFVHSIDGWLDFYYYYY